jgi:hypothetical protein
VTFDHIIAKLSLGTILASDTIFAFLIHFVDLLILLPVMWHKEYIWNFSILQRVQLSNLILILLLCIYTG